MCEALSPDAATSERRTAGVLAARKTDTKAALGGENQVPFSDGRSSERATAQREGGYKNERGYKNTGEADF